MLQMKYVGQPCLREKMFPPVPNGRVKMPSGRTWVIIERGLNPAHLFNFILGHSESGVDC